MLRRPLALCRLACAQVRCASDKDRRLTRGSTQPGPVRRAIHGYIRRHLRATLNDICLEALTITRNSLAHTEAPLH
jgi:hypothetical protein